MTPSTLILVQSRATDWFSQRSPRERILLTGLAALAILFVFVTAIWTPLQASRAAARSEIRTYETLTARLRAAGPALALRPARPNGPPAAVISQTAAEAGLTIQRLQPEGGLIRVAIENAEFDKLIIWLNRLEGDGSLRLGDIKLDRRPAPGVVNAQLTFGGPMTMLAAELAPEAFTSALAYGFAQRNGVLVRPAPDGRLECLHRPGIALESLLEVQRLFGADLMLQPVTEAAFDIALRDQYRDTANDAAHFAAAADTDLAALADSAAAVDDLLDQRDDSPVVRLINALLLEAVKEGASDIHIETQEKRLVVRFRVDGVLRDMIEPKRSLAPLLVSRIKVMARLDIAEKRAPHDGRVTLRVGGLELDVRVSTIPSQHGERVVLRLLDRAAGQLDLATVGMQPRDLAVFERMIERPHGIVLVTGPTGSGKTTTLYAALNRLNDRRRNIMTVEDPIEYALEGVGQMQVNSRIDLSFAKGLRAILRQDPDVIMVGEIRDQETAEVAVRSSMTGHLVLSTLHTNSAVGSVTRLIDMGVERYLLAPMLVGLVAQRLVRRLCPECRREEKATDADRALVGDGLPLGATLFRAQGCPACRQEGYRGRTGVYEVIEVDEAMRALIHDGASEAALTESARRAGPSLNEDGVSKVRAGLTSVEEIARVVREEA